MPAGKNLIGAFHQPVAVYADMDLLATLGRRELVEGIAEAIKMGVIRVPSLFELLEANPQAVMSLEPKLIEQVSECPSAGRVRLRLEMEPLLRLIRCRATGDVSFDSGQGRGGGAG